MTTLEGVLLQHNGQLIYLQFFLSNNRSVGAGLNIVSEGELICDMLGKVQDSIMYFTGKARHSTVIPATDISVIRIDGAYVIEVQYDGFSVSAGFTAGMTISDIVDSLKRFINDIYHEAGR